MKHASIFTLLSILFGLPLRALIEPPRTAADLRIALEKMNVLGSVLYIAAHPDDENTGLMAFLSKERKYRTAYLSLTRGDGGQNLIGSEQGSQIGIIRSQELLEARRYDGGEQYFTRAVDFGYSKSVAETMDFWGKEEVMSDIVRVIRHFRPDVIITRFPADDEQNGGHGHHPAATILALEAFAAAADPARFPEQLKDLSPWQAKRILWNKWRPKPEEMAGLATLDTGSYNPLLGMSYNEIAARSRSMHKSQGFGVLPNRGSQIEYFQLLAGAPFRKDIFDGIDSSWKRIEGAEALDRLLAGQLADFDVGRPWLSLAALLKMDEEIARLEKEPWVRFKRGELRDLIAACAGLFIEPLASDFCAAPGDMVHLSTTMLLRSTDAVQVQAIRFPSLGLVQSLKLDLVHNVLQKVDSDLILPADYALTQPYWLARPPEKGLFHVDDPAMIGLAQNPPVLPVEVDLTLLGRKLTFRKALRYRWLDRVNGEMQRPFEIRPSVSATFAKKNIIFSNGQRREVQVRLKAHAAQAKGLLRLELPGGWTAAPDQIDFEFASRHDERTVSFWISPPPLMQRTQTLARIVVDGRAYARSLVEIRHDHIEPQAYFPESSVRLIRLDTKIPGGRIGYIEGSGDEIPEALGDMGYEVVMLGDEQLSSEFLATCDAVIAGIRAYNTRPRLKYAYTALMDYIQNGGTYIVQYNVGYGLVCEEIGPYPFKIGRERITDEQAELRLLKPEHSLFNQPNRIGPDDFSGWVQERGLYFAESCDKRYDDLVSGHDPGEKELSGSTLFCRYGKGVFIYSGLAWFRQVPAGNPGALRIFVNMISAGRYAR